MSHISTLDQAGDAAVRSEKELEPARGARTIAWLGSWMAILGVIRLTCGIAEYVHICREALGSNVGAGRGWGRFFLENPPIFVLVGAWPLLLGLALRRTRWPELVKAGALTFLVLAVGGVLTAMADWGHAAGGSVAIGSFRVPRLAWDQLELAGKAMAMAGAGSGCWSSRRGSMRPCWPSAARVRATSAPDRNDSVRRSRFGRLAICLSIAFVVLTTRLPAWSTVLEFVTQSQWIREVLLRDDLARIPDRQAEGWARLGVGRRRPGPVRRSRASLERGRYAVAAEKYSPLLAVLLEPIPTATMNSAERRLAALALNNWAWLLATCPDTSLRDAAASVKCARRALEIVPNDANTWNTLGVGYFRLGAWDEAADAPVSLDGAPQRGGQLRLVLPGHDPREARPQGAGARVVRPGGGMAHSRLPGNGELYRFEVEAAEALGLPKPEPQPGPPTPAGMPFGHRPFPPRIPRGRG